MEQRLSLTRFVIHCESCAQDIENVALVIRVFRCSFDIKKKKKNCTATLCIFSLIIVKSLQLRGRR